jgi:predicted Holliday junction resolvase-like endonuclease
LDSFVSSIFTTVLPEIAKGGSSIIFILVAIIVTLLWEIRRLTGKIDSQEKQIFLMIEEAHKNAITSNNALTVTLEGLRMMLFEIRMKL